MDMDMDRVYKRLCEAGFGKPEEVDRTKLAYLLGAVDALRLFCNFQVPEVEYFHFILGAGEDRRLIKCLQSTSM